MDMKTCLALGCGVTSFFLAMMTPAFAVGTPEVSVNVENGSPDMRRAAHYDCGGRGMDVAYINVEPNFLAVVPVEGEKRIFVLVLSGSGARYASGPYVWWTKGREASLYDERKGQNAPPLMTCTQ
jgi:membrane-bound inhibitor of C-type lysozyme